jgi:hypothetical protein
MDVMVQNREKVLLRHFGLSMRIIVRVMIGIGGERGERGRGREREKRPLAIIYFSVMTLPPPLPLP